VRGLTRLCELYLTGIGVTEAGVRRLRRALPRTKIVFTPQMP
jgi:hypothetical protein